MKVIDKVDVQDPSQQEVSWACKLDSFVQKGLSPRDFIQVFYYWFHD